MSIPMSRDEMRSLKAKRDEELRIEKMNRCVQMIYSQAVGIAKTSTNTSYSLDIDPQQTRKMMHMNHPPNSEYQFYKDNMTEILSGLQDLFPGCIVKLAKMCTGNDGKRYDISTMDEKMLPFINQQQAFECIVIDWS
jgi:hypothetical protein